MKLTCEGASPERIQAGEAAALVFLRERGVTMEQVHHAWAVYETWVQGCIGPDDLPPEEGEDIRSLWGEAQEIAVNTARPDLAGAEFRRGMFQLEWYAERPSKAQEWSQMYADRDVPF